MYDSDRASSKPLIENNDVVDATAMAVNNNKAENDPRAGKDHTPPEEDDRGDLTSNMTVDMDEDDFLAKIQIATSSEAPLDLTGFRVTLSKGAIRLKGRQQLEIIGGIIQGQVHSLFQLDGTNKNHPRRLTLRNTKLIHTKVDPDPRQIGAAVFAMGASVAVLTGCEISSKGGFAVWGKHQCNVTVDHCTIRNIARTAVACFNQCNMTVTSTTISHVGIHGVCGRGEVKITLENVIIDDCQTRAIMVYQGGSVFMKDCRISNTHDPTTPTIHAQGTDLLLHDKEEPSELNSSGQQPGNTNGKLVKGKGPARNLPENRIPSLTMIRCKLTNNAGPPIVIEGNVLQDLRDNKID